MKTMTGRGSSPGSGGVHTLIDRQSSLGGGTVVGGSDCGQMGPGCVAWNLSGSEVIGTGAAQRLAPQVSSAYGMPRNACASTPATVAVVPQITPRLVSTAIGQGSSGVAVAVGVAVGVALPLGVAVAGAVPVEVAV